MQPNEGIPGKSNPFNPPISFGDTGASEKWSMLEQRMAHPLLQSLRGIRNGTLRIYLPDGSEVFYLGANPGAHANLRFAEWDALDRVALEGEVALGEEYAVGRCQTTDLRKVLRFGAQNGGAFDRCLNTPPLSRLARFARGKFFPDGPRRMKLHGPCNTGNDFYRLWLDETMSFSGALFHGDTAMPSEEAQRAKFRRVLGRLDPQKGEHILELGCGWGGFMEEAARLNIRTTGVTPLAEQAAFAQERLAGFAGLSKVLLEDYRHVTGTFDAIVSFGMFETIGEAAWPDFMAAVSRNLRPGGRAVIETAIVRGDIYEEYQAATDFARAHIARKALISTRARVEYAARRAGLVVSDVCSFGGDQALAYDRWIDRFDKAAPQLRALGYEDGFIRKWGFHLANRAAQFDLGRFDMIQVELTKPRG